MGKTETMGKLTMILIGLMCVSADNTSIRELRHASPEAMSEALHSSIQGSLVECLSIHRVYGSFSRLLCIDFDGSNPEHVDDVRVAVDRVTEHFPSARFDPWHEDELGPARRGMVGDVPTLITIDFWNRILVYQYPASSKRSCFEHEAKPAPGDELIEPAELIVPGSVTYPLLAKVARIRGLVFAEAVIATDGTVSDVCVRESNRPGMGFEEAAAEAIYRNQYEPARRLGEPVVTRRQVVFEFAPDGQVLE